jgi:hypothetical protein
MKRTALLRKKRISPVSAKRRKRSGQPGKLGIVRLYGSDLTGLRRECFERDGYRCQRILHDLGFPRRCLKKVRWESGHPDSGHMAHVRNKRMYGDVIDNVSTNCDECHLIDDHNPKSVPSKT